MNNKVKFRTLTAHDINALAKILSSSTVCENTPFGPNTFQETENYFKPLLDEITTSEKKAQDKYLIAIVVNNEIIGNVGVFNKNNDEYEIGYNLAQEYWNKGIMSSAVHRICNILAAKKKAKRITASVMSSNSASLKVLEKNGFKVSRIHFNKIVKNEKIYDEIIMLLNI